MKGMVCGRQAVLGIVLVLSVLCFFGVSWAGEDFSADFTSKSTEPQDMPGQGKIYVKGNTMRMECSGAITIFNPDQGVVWILMAPQRMYMEQPIQNASGRMQQWNKEMERAAKKVGKESVSGLKCTKYELEHEGAKSYYWISDKIDFPVKMQDGNGSMLLENIQIGKVSGDLFKIPAGYRKFSMPSGASGMPGGMGLPSRQ